MNPPPIVTIAFSHFNDFPSGRQTFLSNIGYPAFYLCSPSKKSGSINCEKPMSVLFLVQMPVCERGCGRWGRGACIPVCACVRACVCVRACARAPFKQNAAHTIVSHYKRQKRKKEKKSLIFQRARTVTHSHPADGLQETPTQKKRAEWHSGMHALKFLRGSFPDTANSFASGCCVRKRTTLIIYKARGATRPASSIWFCAAVLQCEVPILCAAPHCVIIGLSQR